VRCIRCPELEARARAAGLLGEYQHDRVAGRTERGWRRGLRRRNNKPGERGLRPARGAQGRRLAIRVNCYCPIRIRTRERRQMRGQTSPFEYVTVSTIGAGSASTIVEKSCDGTPKN
jgi:hypothetical protein